MKYGHVSVGPRGSGGVLYTICLSIIHTMGDIRSKQATVTIDPQKTLFFFFQPYPPPKKTPHCLNIYTPSYITPIEKPFLPHSPFPFYFFSSVLGMLGMAMLSLGGSAFLHLSSTRFRSDVRVIYPSDSGGGGLGTGG